MNPADPKWTLVDQAGSGTAAQESSSVYIIITLGSFTPARLGAFLI